MESRLTLRQKQMLDDVFDAFSMLVNGTMVSLMHVEGGVTRYTRSAVELFELPGEYIPNGAYDWNDYLHPEDRKRYMDVMVPLLEGKTQTYDITYRVRTKSGEYGVFRAVGAVLRGENGKPSLIGGAMFNEGMTNNTDPVTVLPNKDAYMERLADGIREGKHAYSLLTGISGLAGINQKYGYTYGNRVLCEVAWIIQETAGEQCSIFRMDGATFAILTDSLSREQVAAIYDMIRYRLQRGVEINGIRNTLIANGGMIGVFGQNIDVSTVYDCLRYAYEESRQHRHGELVDFNGSINYSGVESLERISAIRTCVRNECAGFALEYEPVIDAVTGHLNGAEAMVYWEDPRFGKVEPEDFLPVLEQDFLFEELGDFVIRQGLTEGRQLLDVYPGFLLCLNVYRIQLESDFFVDNLLQVLEETAFPPELLSLKFASDCRYLEKSRLDRIIEELHRHRILVIIDGFGSGTDSVIFLKTASVDAVCLDSQFLQNIENSRRDRDILEYLTRMAATCVQHINTKGVDTEQVREILLQFPVTTMQGRLFSELLTFDQMRERLSRGGGA